MHDTVAAVLEPLESCGKFHLVAVLREQADQISERLVVHVFEATLEPHSFILQQPIRDRIRAGHVGAQVPLDNLTVEEHVGHRFPEIGAALLIGKRAAHAIFHTAYAASAKLRRSIVHTSTSGARTRDLGSDGRYPGNEPPSLSSARRSASASSPCRLTILRKA